MLTISRNVVNPVIALLQALSRARTASRRKSLTYP